MRVEKTAVCLPGAHLVAHSLQVISPVISHLLHLAAQLPPLPLQPGLGLPHEGVDPGQVGLDVVGEGPHHLLVVVPHPARGAGGEAGGQTEEDKAQPGIVIVRWTRLYRNDRNAALFYISSFLKFHIAHFVRTRRVSSLRSFSIVLALLIVIYNMIFIELYK